MIVIGELYQSGRLQLMSDFIDVNENTWAQWSYKFLNSSASWMWRKLWYGGYNDQTKFVLKELLEVGIYFCSKLC